MINNSIAVDLNGTSPKRQVTGGKTHGWVKGVGGLQNSILKADLLEFLELEAISEGWGIPGIPGKPSEL